MSTGEHGEGPAAREQPCSRAASQNSLLTANLQTRGENLAAGQTSAPLTWLLNASFPWPACGKVKHLKLPYGVDGTGTGITYFFTTALCALAHSQKQWLWEHTTVSDLTRSAHKRACKKKLIWFTLHCVYFLSNQIAVLQVRDSL